MRAMGKDVTLFPLATADLADLLEDVEHVMLDFDGPLRAEFAGGPAPGVFPGAPDVLAAARRTGRVVSIVSDYAHEEALLAYAVQCERSSDEARRTSVLVGSSVAVIEAAKASGVLCIAFVTEPGRRREFAEIGAAVVMTDLRELAEALNARWDVQWCRIQGGCGC